MRRINAKHIGLAVAAIIAVGGSIAYVLDTRGKAATTTQAQGSGTPIYIINEPGNPVASSSTFSPANATTTTTTSSGAVGGVGSTGGTGSSGPTASGGPNPSSVPVAGNPGAPGPAVSQTGNTLTVAGGTYSYDAKTSKYDIYSK